MNNYLAITIGPIYKTMAKARKTRELWSASFSFSLLMKCLINEFSKKGKLLSPSPDVRIPLHGAGVYPDRCYFLVTQKVSKEDIEFHKNNAILEFCSTTGYTSSEIDYFQVYIVLKTLSANPIQSLNVILDALELSGKYFSKNPFQIERYWQDSSFFKNLYKKGFGEEADLPPLRVFNRGHIRIIRRFKSIPEIATVELEQKEIDKYFDALGIQFLDVDKNILDFEEIALNKENYEFEDDVICTVKRAFEGQFKFRHKYFAIVQADGDNVGSLIRELEAKNGKIMEFSNSLNTFVESAAEELVKYGAFPIYLGGDDLLFFAPLTNENYIGPGIDFNPFFNTQNVPENVLQGTNLFYLFSRLNIIFKEKLATIVNTYMPNTPVSLSFGVSVGYYKKPMNEMLDESYERLFKDAKGQPCKNYIALKLEKHSGQSFNFGFAQNTRLYYHFLKLCKESEEKKESFLNSVMFKINNQRKVIVEIAGDKSRMENFFAENFNEAGHNNFRGFFEEIINLIYETFSWFAHEKPLHENQEDKRISRIYNALRFVQFLNADDSHE